MSPCMMVRARARRVGLRLRGRCERAQRGVHIERRKGLVPEAAAGLRRPVQRNRSLHWRLYRCLLRTRAWAWARAARVLRSAWLEPAGGRARSWPPPSRSHAVECARATPYDAAGRAFLGQLCLARSWSWPGDLAFSFECRFPVRSQNPTHTLGGARSACAKKIREGMMLLLMGFA